MAGNTGKKETAEEKEKRRQISLRNLDEETLKNLALAYLVNNEKDFGEADNSAVEQFKYIPAITGEIEHKNENGKNKNILLNSLLGSRQGGKRYTGNVSEYKIINDAWNIMHESLAGVKIEDVLKLIGSNSAFAKGYSDKYLSDFLESENDKDKEFANVIINSYLGYFASSGISDAHSKKAVAVRKNLESFLTESMKEEAERKK